MGKSELVLWAIDPYSDLKKKSVRSLAFIKLLMAKNSRLQPTYVLSPESLKWDRGVSARWLNHLRASVAKTITSLRLKGVSGQNVLVSKGVVRGSDAETLCNFAAKKKADFIVLHTHARQGVKRLFLGSFAEAVMLKTKTPLLIFNPHIRPPSRIKKILVPIDLSPKAIRAFRKMIPFLKRLGAEVELYNKMMDPIEPVVQSGVLMAGGGWVGFDQFRHTEMIERESHLNRLAQDLRKHGIRASGAVEERYGLITTLVEEVADRENCQLILMGTEVGTAGVWMWGSVARSMARESTLPLMVYPIR